MDNTAVIIESLSATGPLHYSYNELVSLYTALASTIQHFTPYPRTHVGVYCENSVELVVSFLAILSIEYVFVPLTAHNLHLITNLPVALALVRAELLHQFLDIATVPCKIETQCIDSGIVICRYNFSLTGDENNISISTKHFTSLFDLFSHSMLHNFSPPVLQDIQPSHSTAYVLQSSGTTGLPKTIRVPHSSLIPNILDLSRLFSLTSRDICFLSAPPTFDPSLVQILTSLISGCTLLIVPPPACTCYPYLFIKHNVTILQCTPSLMYTFSLTQCKQLLGPSSPLRVLALGGENCPPVSTLRGWKHSDNRTHLYNLYGITEVSCWATCHTIQLRKDTEWDNFNLSTEEVIKREFEDISSLKDLVPIGPALSDTRVELRMVRAEDILGEIWVGGANRRCEVGEDRREEMRETGDVGILSGGSGDIYCLGRRDKQLKRLGHRMNLLSVERYVRGVPGVDTCVVRRDKGRIVAFLVTNNDSIIIRKRIQEDIPSKYRPDLIKFLPTIPLTPHGKLDTSLLSLTLPSLSQAIRDFFSEEFSILPLVPSSLSLSQLGVDSFELVSLTTRLQDLTSQYPQHSGSINSLFESLYEFMSSHPSNLLSDTISKRLQMMQEQGTPLAKRSRVESIHPLTCPETLLHDNIITLRRGSISCSRDSLPSPLLPHSNPMSLSLNWSHDTGKCVDASPLLCYHLTSHELTLYIGSHSRLFTALRASDGVCLWRTELDDRVESSAAISHCGCYLIVGSYSGAVWVLDREGGGVHWVYSTGSQPVKSSPCVDSSTGLVWVGTHSSTLVSLDVIRKVCVFCVDTRSGSCYSSPVADTGLGAVYVGTHGGDLIRVSGRVGNIEWRCSLKKAIFSSPALLPDHSLIVGNAGGSLYCVTSEGVLKWCYDVKGPLFSSACVVQLSTAVHIFIGTHSGRVLSLNSQGDLKWEYQTDSDIFSIPFALLDIVVIAMINGTVLLLNFAGTPLCSYKLPSEVFSSPVMARSQVFVGCRDNNVYCLDISCET